MQEHALAEGTMMAEPSVNYALAETDKQLDVLESLVSRLEQTVDRIRGDSQPSNSGMMRPESVGLMPQLNLSLTRITELCTRMESANMALSEWF